MLTVRYRAKVRISSGRAETEKLIAAHTGPSSNGRILHGGEMSQDRFVNDKAKIRDELERRAKARATMTYGEAAALIELPNQGLSPILYVTNEEEAELGRPNIGCLVVRADTGFPADVGIEQVERERALVVRRAVFAAWKTMA